MRDLTDESVVCGVHGHPRAPAVVARVLRALSSRVQASGAGVAVPGAGPRARRSADPRLLDDRAALEALGGDVAVGSLHAGTSVEAGLGLLDPPRRPAHARVGDAWIALAASGAGPGDAALAGELSQEAPLDDGGLDALLLGLVGRARQRTPVNRLVEALWRHAGGHAVVLAAPGRLVGVRDPRGLRPLVLGVVDDAHVLASDAAGILGAGGALLRALEPGEMLVVDERGLVSLRPFARVSPAPCFQEALQLAGAGAPDPGGAWTARQALGEVLPRDRGLQVVVAGDDAARPLAEGAARAGSLPLLDPWVAVGDGMPVAFEGPVKGRKVLVVGAGLQEGLRARVAALWGAGAAEVHVRLPAPPRAVGCPYGVRGEPVGAGGAEDLRDRLGASSLAWLPIERTAEVLGLVSPCTACVGGPWPIPAEGPSDQLPLFGAEGSRGAVPSSG